MPGLPKSKIKRVFKDLKCSSEELSYHLIWLRTRHESKCVCARVCVGGGDYGELSPYLELTDVLGSPRAASVLPSPLSAALSLPELDAAHTRPRKQRCADGSDRLTDRGARIFSPHFYSRAPPRTHSWWHFTEASLCGSAEFLNAPRTMWARFKV